MKSTTIASFRLLPASLLLLLSSAASGQLAPFNDFGVVMGHLHLNSADIPAQKKFWVDIVGAKPIMLGNIQGVSMPGTVVLFTAAAPTGPTEGSTINHIGILTSGLEPYAAKLDAAGIKYVRNPNGKQLMVDGPEGLKFEISADPSVSGIRFHHVHFSTADPLAIQSWYAEKFGAKPGKRAIWEAGDIPGANLTYAKAPGDVAPSVKRVLDHIGFEVRDLEAFCKKLEASGVKFDIAYRKVPSLGIAIAFLTDPWGTRIELTEGLGKI